MDYLASGTKRDVFDLGNGYVLKIAKSEAGAACNETELRLYRECPDLVRKYLAPIVKGSEQWLVMQKFETRMPLHPNYLAWLGIIEERFRSCGINPRDLTFGGKPILQNLRVDSNGRIMLIDYGSFRPLTAAPAEAEGA